MPNVGVQVPNNNIYFHLFHLPHMSQIKCHEHHNKLNAMYLLSSAVIEKN